MQRDAGMGYTIVRSKAQLWNFILHSSEGNLKLENRARTWPQKHPPDAFWGLSVHSHFGYYLISGNREQINYQGNKPNYM